jgi:hypothetical protein
MNAPSPASRERVGVRVRKVADAARNILTLTLPSLARRAPPSPAMRERGLSRMSHLETIII